MNAGLLLVLALVGLAARAQVPAQDPPQPPVHEEPRAQQQVGPPVPAEDPAPSEPPAQEPPAQEPPAPDEDPSGLQTPVEATPGAAPDAAPAAPEPEPAPVPRLDFTREIGADALAAELVRIAERDGELVSIASIGKSRAGRDILLATVGDRRSGNPDRRPALFVTADLGAQDAPRAGAQAGLFAVAELVARARDDARVAELLQRATVYVVPAPDPDVLEDLVLHDPAHLSAEAISASLRIEREVGTHGRVGLNENFPVGWQPFAREDEVRGTPPGARERTRPGPYPLCEPESLALARCLLERRNVAACVLTTQRVGGLAGCEPGVAAHDVVRRLGLAPELERALCSRAALADEPGSLPAFCAARLASLTFLAPAWDGSVLETSLGAVPAGFAHALELVLALLSELPRIEPGEPEVERLRPDLWQVDVPLVAAGALCATPRGARPIEGLNVSVKGGLVELVAVRRAGETAFRPIDGARPAADGAARAEHALGALESGAPIVVRLVVRALPATRLELVLGSSSTGRASVLALLE